MSKEESHAQERFLETYDTLGDSVYRFIRLRLADHEAVLDLTQETFTRYWDHVREGKPVGNECALIFTIARRLVIDRYRAKRTDSLDELREEEGFDPVDEYEPPPSLKAEGEEALATLAELPEEYREALLLRFVEGLEPREIASILGLSANAVSVRIHRGIDTMRARMHVPTP